MGRAAKAEPALSSSIWRHISRDSYSRITTRVRGRSPAPLFTVSCTSSWVRMTSFTLRTALAGLSATRLSASRLLAGRKRFNLSNSW
eukprot:5122164-Pleurochrysis_carterae.AAC.1